MTALRSSITLQRGLPDCPAGTVFTLDKEGVYRDPTGLHWIAPRHVDENPSLVEREPAAKETPYFYFDDIGEVVEAVWNDAPDDLKRKAYGNVFRSPEEAAKAVEVVREALGGQPPSVARERAKA